MRGAFECRQKECDGVASANLFMSAFDDDPVPPGLILDLDEAFRVLEALEDALTELHRSHSAPGLRDELATVIRLLHGRLGLDEGGVE